MNKMSLEEILDRATYEFGQLADQEDMTLSDESMSTGWEVSQPTSIVVSRDGESWDQGSRDAYFAAEEFIKGLEEGFNNNQKLSNITAYRVRAVAIPTDYDENLVAIGFEGTF